MPARESEALILRTYPYREADLIVSFFTRDQGKLRGVAKAVRRPKSRFGSGLERLSYVRVFYFQKETQELVKLDRCERIGPPVFLRADYSTMVALDFLAEVSEQLLPDHESNDAYFRLLVLVLNEMWTGLSGNENGSSRVSVASAAGRTAAQSVQAGAAAAPSAPQGPDALAEAGGSPGWLWRALTYFLLWAVRFGGWLPPLNVCIRTGAELGPGEVAYFERSQPGLFSAEYRHGNCWPMSAESRAIAAEMLKRPLPDLKERRWNRQTAEDLRRFLTQRLEAQFESRLKTAALMAEL